MFSTATTRVVKLSIAPMIKVHQGPSSSPRRYIPKRRPRATKNMIQFLSSLVFTLFLAIMAFLGGYLFDSATMKSRNP